MLRLLRSESGADRESDPLERHAATRLKNPADEVDIGLVGKYVEYEDSYKSLKEALLHGGLAHKREGEHRLDRGRGARVARLRSGSWSVTTGSWFPAASASAASKA